MSLDQEFAKLRLNKYGLKSWKLAIEAKELLKGFKSYNYLKLEYFRTYLNVWLDENSKLYTHSHHGSPANRVLIGSLYVAAKNNYVEKDVEIGIFKEQVAKEASKLGYTNQNLVSQIIRRAWFRKIFDVDKTKDRIKLRYGIKEVIVS